MVEQSIQKLTEHMSEEKIILKMLEECAELSEILLKYLTKRPENRPPLDKIVEELGDVIYRGKVLASKMNIEDKVNTRVSEKAEILFNWIKETFEN